MSHLHTREVASGVVNLGSTCYMNAVLQALAHSPELLSAIECESHHKNCPIASDNAKRRKLELEKEVEEEAKKAKENDENDESDNGDCPAIKSEEMNTTSCTDDNGIKKVKKGPSPNTTYKRRKINGKNNGIQQDTNNDNSDEFCLLCEMEKHLMRVHYSGSLGFLEENYDEISLSNEPNSAATSSIENNGSGGGPIAPSTFVHGFVSHVAPSFKLGVQEDSHEFLRLLIDGMQKSCRKVKEIKSEDNSLPSNDNTAVKQECNENMNTEMFQECVENMSAKVKIKLEEVEMDQNNNLVGSEAKQNEEKSNKKASSQTNDGNEYAYRLFRGKVESIVTCSHCGAVSSTVDPIEDIGLEVTSTSTISTSYNGRFTGRGRHSPTPTSLSNLNSALEKFIKMETLDSGYKCEGCNTCGMATKQSKLASIPPILTFHLKRFRYGRDGAKGFGDPIPSRRRNNELAQLLGTNDLGGSGSAKVEGHVQFGIVLDMKKYLTKELQDELGGKNVMCKLFAVVVHAGKNSHSGHYICYVRNIAKNEWWKMDDSKVTRVLVNEVLAAEAYMLFYRVVNHPVSIELSEREKANRALMAKKIAVLKEEKIKNEELTNMRADNDSRSNYNHSKKRKREDPRFKSGEEWIKAMTHIPDSWIPGIRKAQDYISQCINFNPSYFRDIQDEAKECGVLGAGPKIGIDEGDIKEKMDFSNAVKELLRTLIKPHQKDIIPQKDTTISKEENGTTAKGSNSATNDDNAPKSKPFLFPVFDANETML